MGVCLSTKQQKRADFSDKTVRDMPEKPPLKALKDQLVSNLYLDESHHFAVFARYHFWNSYRRSLKMCQKNYLEQEQIEEMKQNSEMRANLKDGSVMQRKKGAQPTPMEDNMLMATWLDGVQSTENEMHEKLLFFINETLLEKRSINYHFQREHKKLFLEKNIEFMCRKGKINNSNQDNFFILLDGEVKIYGLFDGHGQNGHQVSSFAQSKVLDFIRNKHGDFFDQDNLVKSATNEAITRKIKQCFKYVQKELKNQYKVYRHFNDQSQNRYNLPDPNVNYLGNLLTMPVSDSNYTEHNESGHSSSRRGSRRNSQASPRSSHHQKSLFTNDRSKAPSGLFRQQRRNSANTRAQEPLIQINQYDLTPNQKQDVVASTFNLPLNRIEQTQQFEPSVMKQLSPDEEAELNEFCDSSSWETSSARSDDSKGNYGRSGNLSVRGLRHRNDSRSNSDSSESIHSDKLTQSRWEINETHKFQHNWQDLQREIADLEHHIATANPNLPTTVQSQNRLQQKRQQKQVIENFCREERRPMMATQVPSASENAPAPLGDNNRQKMLEHVQLKLLKERSEQEQKYFDIALSGTSATLVIQLPNKKLIIGYVGNSRVAIQNREKTGGNKGPNLTEKSHSPDAAEEKIRIYNNQGEIRRSNLDKKSKIYVRARMYPGLTISRSLGDLIAHQIGVTSEPDIVFHDIQPTDRFFTIASDGVWNHLQSDDVGEIVSEYGLKEPGSSCQLVAQKIKELCQSESVEMDDTTMIISYLNVH